MVTGFAGTSRVLRVTALALAVDHALARGNRTHPRGAVRGRRATAILGQRVAADKVGAVLDGARVAIIAGLDGVDVGAALPDWAGLALARGQTNIGSAVAAVVTVGGSRAAPFDLGIHSAQAQVVDAGGDGAQVAVVATGALFATRRAGWRVATGSANDVATVAGAELAIVAIGGSQATSLQVAALAYSRRVD